MKHAIVITHKNLGHSLLEALVAITGNRDYLDAISNENMSLDSLIDSIEQKVTVIGDHPVYLMVEFKGGSPYLASRKVAMKHKNVYLLSGVNLPMLISFVMKKDMYSEKELFDILKNDAFRGITGFNLETGEQ
ncbi:MAG: PTS sugar transporter subunit IIA [Calditrichia bacterium]